MDSTIRFGVRPSSYKSNPQTGGANPRSAFSSLLVSQSQNTTPQSSLFGVFVMVEVAVPAGSSLEAKAMMHTAEAGSSLEPQAPGWVVAWAEAKDMKRRVGFMNRQIERLSAMVNDLDGILAAKSTADERGVREKRDTAAEQLRAAISEFVELSLEMGDPDFTGMPEGLRVAEADKLRVLKLRKARRLEAAGDPEAPQVKGEARIIDFDPKQNGPYYNRCCFVDLAKFDLNEESPHGPMRFTDSLQTDKPIHLCGGVNILTVKIACSDVGYPIRLYGSVVARDCIDKKCVYLFRRDRDNSQLISSKDKPLILTGPKRGLALLDSIYLEINLKIKDDNGKDRQLSKGFLSINGMARRSLEKCEVETKSLSTRLSTVDVMYEVVPIAVEATIAVEVIEGHFDGIIFAHTSSTRKSLVLYDSIVPGHGRRVVQLKRPVVSVFVKDALMVAAKAADGKSVCGIAFTSKMKGREEVVITVGITKLRVKVAWSIMDP